VQKILLPIHSDFKCDCPASDVRENAMDKITSERSALDGHGKQ